MLQTVPFSILNGNRKIILHVAKTSTANMYTKSYKNTLNIIRRLGGVSEVFNIKLLKILFFMYLKTLEF